MPASPPAPILPSLTPSAVPSAMPSAVSATPVPSGTAGSLATAVPTPSGGGGAVQAYCDMLTGPAKTYCQNGDAGTLPGVPGNAVQTAGFVADPLGSIAKGCADAATWIIEKLSATVNGSTSVDFTNPGFLRQYAVVFAASTFLTLLLWMLAVAKRAVRGASITTAITEAVGYLWLAVLASAFTPLTLYLAVSLTDGVTSAIASGTQQDTDRFLGGFAKALGPNSGLGGGPVMLIFVSLLSMAAAAVLWCELLVRAAMLYVGAMLGTAVYSGLVDKAMWHHVRRWAGIMVAVLLAKPVVVIVLGLATAVSATDGQQDAFGSVLSGLAIMVLSIFATALIYRFVPNLGDDMASLHGSRRAMAAGGAAMVSGPANFMKQGIRAHAGRGGGGGGGEQPGPAAAGAVASGISAHGTRGTAARPAAPAPAPSPTPPPSAGNPSNTPHARTRNEA
ncbi:hypothetical protein [Yinghuangia seranimata]|uniref:hypothetical protein n=1 Tax=Yinghuangia seranimata TaxID=408067 RepID=UPI00248BC14D|nr:hypothetical protein [Yinghuangia seranimata]MDI2132641.1 hypothetical protein [Yinghuangia seranimata]